MLCVYVCTWVPLLWESVARIRRGKEIAHQVIWHMKLPFFLMFIFERERERARTRARASGGGAEREGDRIQSWL